LHIILSDPLLNSLGFNYSGEEGKFYEKLHPGSILIIIAFFIFLFISSSPIDKIITISRTNKAAIKLLFICTIAFFYMGLRSGFAGLAFIIDTHICGVICAIILQDAQKKYSGQKYCRKALNLFTLLAVTNSIIAIFEAIYQVRIFEFPADWLVLKEENFRSSAFLGHPLNNAIFTCVALFVMLVSNYNNILKTFFGVIFIISLLAFGGRAALLFAISGSIFLIIINAKEKIRSQKLSLDKMLLSLALYLSATLAIIFLLYYAISQGFGERIFSHLTWDASANTRILAFKTLDYMTIEEIFIGISAARIMEIAYRINLIYPLADIENPWLLMFMELGGVMFLFWFAAMLNFIKSLLKNKNIALKIAIYSYLIIASTANSFGRKDSVYIIMICAIICADKTIKNQKLPEPSHTKLLS